MRSLALKIAIMFGHTNKSSLITLFESVKTQNNNETCFCKVKDALSADSVSVNLSEKLQNSVYEKYIYREWPSLLLSLLCYW